jgi:hypothetical protein
VIKPVKGAVGTMSANVDKESMRKPAPQLAADSNHGADTMVVVAEAAKADHRDPGTPGGHNRETKWLWVRG